MSRAPFISYFVWLPVPVIYFTNPEEIELAFLIYLVWAFYMKNNKTQQSIQFPRWRTDKLRRLTIRIIDTFIKSNSTKYPEPSCMMYEGSKSWKFRATNPAKFFFFFLSSDCSSIQGLGIRILLQLIKPGTQTLFSKLLQSLDLVWPAGSFVPSLI